jgi:hypothetical protein
MIPLEVLGISSDGHSPPVVILRHEQDILPIVVGLAEADAIHAALTHRDLGRPMTHDLIRNLLAGLNGTLESVSIYKLENDTFYAHLNIEQRGGSGQVEQVLRVDSRPSDGIAIALRTESPILVAEEVMDRAKQDLSVLGGIEESDEEDEDEDEENDEPF